MTQQAVGKMLGSELAQKRFSSKNLIKRNFYEKLISHRQLWSIVDNWKRLRCTLKIIMRGTVVFWKVFIQSFGDLFAQAPLKTHQWFRFQTARVKTMKNPKAIILKGALVWYRIALSRWCFQGVHVIPSTWSTSWLGWPGQPWLGMENDDSEIIFDTLVLKKKRHSTLTVLK